MNKYGMKIIHKNSILCNLSWQRLLMFLKKDLRYFLYKLIRLYTKWCVDVQIDEFTYLPLVFCIACSYNQTTHEISFVKFRFFLSEQGYQGYQGT